MVEVKFKNAAIREFINKLPDNKKVAAFEERFTEFLSFLDSLPTEIDVSLMPQPEWFKLSYTDYQKAYDILNKETNKSIEFIYLVSSFKIRSLLITIIGLFEERKYYEAVSLMRTLMEVNCFSNHLLDLISDLVKKLNVSKMDYLEYNKINAEIEELTIMAKRGTRIKKLVEKDSFVDTKNILDAIDSVSKKEKYRTARAKYNILCEYVHPNAFSNFMFGIPTSVEEDEKTREYLDEKIIIIPGETTKFFREMPEEWSGIIVLYFGILISTLLLNFELFKETVDGFKKLSADKLEAKPPHFDRINKLNENDRNKMLDTMMSQMDDE